MYNVQQGGPVEGSFVLQVIVAAEQVRNYMKIIGLGREAEPNVSCFK